MFYLCSIFFRFFSLFFVSGFKLFVLFSLLLLLLLLVLLLWSLLLALMLVTSEVSGLKLRWCQLLRAALQVIPHCTGLINHLFSGFYCPVYFLFFFSGFHGIAGFLCAYLVNCLFGGFHGFHILRSKSGHLGFHGFSQFLDKLCHAPRYFAIFREALACSTLHSR
jgi:hypothetical protein